MKKLVLSILFLLSVSFLQAQSTDFKPQWFLGAKGGALLSSVSFTPSIGSSFALGTNCGLMARYISNKYMWLQFELLYEEKGWREPQNNHNRVLHYLSLPFVTHITFGKKAARGFFNVGPEVSYLLKEDGLLYQAEFPQHEPVVNKFDYGIVGGLGFEIRTKVGIYQLEARYYFGIGNIYGNSATAAFNLSSNQNIAINFAILFGL